MADKTILVGLARLWGGFEGLTLADPTLPFSKAMKGYDDMDLTNLLNDWVEEFEQGEYEGLDDYFEAKINALVMEGNSNPREET